MKEKEESLTKVISTKITNENENWTKFSRILMIHEGDVQTMLTCIKFCIDQYSKENIIKDNKIFNCIFINLFNEHENDYGKNEVYINYFNNATCDEIYDVFDICFKLVENYYLLTGCDYYHMKHEPETMKIAQNRINKLKNCMDLILNFKMLLFGIIRY